MYTWGWGWKSARTTESFAMWLGRVLNRSMGNETDNCPKSGQLHKIDRATNFFLVTKQYTTIFVNKSDSMRQHIETVVQWMGIIYYNLLSKCYTSEFVNS